MRDTIVNLEVNGCRDVVYRIRKATPQIGLRLGA